MLQGPSLELDASHIEELIAPWYAQRPDAPACLDAHGHLTYQQLSEVVERVSGNLHELLHPGALVGVCVERDRFLPALLLGILRNGAAYMPVDPQLPQRRLQQMADDAGLDLLITDADQHPLGASSAVQLHAMADLLERSPQNPDAVRHPPTLEDLAYVIYTSGSTGKPNGVEILHRGVVNLLTSLRRELRFGLPDHWLAITALSFDISVLELMLPLSCGGRVTIVPRDAARDPRSLSALIRDLEPTFLQATPTTWQMLIQDGWHGARHLTALAGGEVLPDATARFLERNCGRLFNLYGPTETTVWSAIHELDHESPPPIGTPIANTRMYVLDADLRPVPDGEPGELYIAGLGLARGYRNNPALTDTRFIADPFTRGERMYATGDRVRTSGGVLEFLGRTDFQVKIRGHRVELPEIEQELLRLDEVSQAAVLLRKPDDQIVAHVVPAAADFDEGFTRRKLARALPTYMLPQMFVLHDRFPTTAGGKVDREALAKTVPSATTAAMADRTPTHARLAEIWHDLLGNPPRSYAESFFAAGGQSITALRMLAQVERSMGVALTLADLQAHPTIGALAKLIAEQDSTTARGEIPRRATQSGPLSNAQRVVWQFCTLYPDSVAYNLGYHYQTNEALDVTRLRAALAAALRRFEALRGRVDSSDPDNPLFTISPWSSDVPLQVESTGSRRQALEICSAMARAPYDLAHGPLCRFGVITYPGGTLVSLNFHHLVFDDHSCLLFTAFVSRAYRGKQSESDSGEDQGLGYLDYTLWEAEQLATQREDVLRYWRSTLRTAEATEIPAAAPRSDGKISTTRILRARLDEHGSDALRNAAMTHGCTHFQAMLSTLFVLLHRYGQQSAVIGVPSWGRYHHGAYDLVGMFVKTLPVTVDIHPNDTFSSVVSRVRSRLAEGMANHAVALDDILHAIRDDVGGQFNPVQIFFSFESTVEQNWLLGEAELRYQPSINNDPQFPMSINVIDDGEEISICVEYDSERFARTTVEWLLDRYQRLLLQSSYSHDASVSDFHLQSVDEQALLRSINDVSAPIPNVGLPALLFGSIGDEQATAIEFDESRRSYRDLRIRTAVLAKELAQAGVREGDLVAVMMGGCADLIPLFLAVLSLGAGLVPLDPTHPRRRLEQIIEDSGARLVCVRERAPNPLAESALTTLRIGDWPDRLDSEVDASIADPGPEALAYVMYTSGSTGTPRGVRVPHRALVNLLCDFRSRLAVGPEDTMLAATTPSFDIAMLELFLPLAAGATVRIAPLGATRDLARLADLLSERVTLFQATPTLLRALVESGWTGHPGLTIISGGETLPRDLADALLCRCRRLFNAYGPTETTVWSTIDQVSREPQPPAIGRPIKNTSVYVLDEHRRTVPVDVPGELFIGGLGVALGYHNDSQRTRERFVAIPQAEGTVFRTGDRVLLRADGRLEYLQRLDGQIKVRGFRVEPAEIEAALAASPGVSQAVVRKWVVEGGDERLVAYLVHQGDTPASLPELRKRLRSRLPSFMVPQHFVWLDHLPVTPSGKVAYSKLPLPRELHVPTPAEPPRTATERMIAEIWCSVVGCDAVGRQQTFFEVGGHSVTAVKSLARIDKALGVRLTFHTLASGTLAEVAEACDTATADRNGNGRLASRFRAWLVSLFVPGRSA